MRLCKRLCLALHQSEHLPYAESGQVCRRLSFIDHPGGGAELGLVKWLSQGLPDIRWG